MDGEVGDLEYWEYYDLATRRPRKAVPTPLPKDAEIIYVFDGEGVKVKQKADGKIVRALPSHWCKRVNSKELTPTQIHAALVTLLGTAMAHRTFVKWSDNMCHFDTVLMLNLVCYCVLGVQHWEQRGGTDARAVSYNDRCILDLLCSLTSASEADRMALRNEFMWEAMSGNETYGKFADAMMHMCVAHCKADEYHAVKTTYTTVQRTACTCREGQQATSTQLQGCVTVSAMTQRGGRTLNAHTLDVALRNAWAPLSGERLRCGQEVPRTSARAAKVRCSGVLDRSVQSIQVGALLCLGVEPGLALNMGTVLEVGTLQYELVGLCLWSGAHYKCQFRLGTTGTPIFAEYDGTQWWEYDDLPSRGEPHIRTVDDPFATGVYISSNKRWKVRGLWYTHTGSAGQPVETQVRM